MGISFSPQRLAVAEADLTEAFRRLPGRWRVDPVIVDNLRYVLEDL